MSRIAIVILICHRHKPIYLIVLERNYTQADTKQHPFLSFEITDSMHMSKSRERILYVEYSMFCERNGLSRITSALRKIPRGRNEDWMKVRGPWYGVKYYLTIFNNYCKIHTRCKRELSRRCDWRSTVTFPPEGIADLRMEAEAVKILTGTKNSRLLLWH
jgi:hypothetical protein